jgi:hypothetical protein
MPTAYDPLVPPDPAEWHALSELDQIALVEAYHRKAGIALPNEQIHAVLHTVVESQIAAGQELPVAATMVRLQNEGLDRHEALHAVASVLAVHLQALVQGQRGGGDPNAPYYEELYHLTAKEWLAQWGPDGCT